MSKYSFLFWSLWFHLVICCSKSAAWLTAEFCSWLAIWVWTCCHSSVPQSLPCRLWLHMLSALQDRSPCIVQCDEVVIHLYVNNHYQQVEQGSFRLNLNLKIQQHWRYEKERFLPNECRSWKFYVSDVGFWHQHDLLWKNPLNTNKPYYWRGTSDLQALCVYILQEHLDVCECFLSSPCSICLCTPPPLIYISLRRSAY